MATKPSNQRSRPATRKPRKPRNPTRQAHRQPASGGILARDAYHSAISAALDRQLDPNLFEACAADLLREIYPSLTPVRGGSDLGKDGIIAPANRRPFPLVTTVGTNAKANLVRNLTRAGRGGRKPTRAVFATSRRITPQARQSLEKAVEQLGVRWLQIFDHDWFADTLYRHETWARRLLNVTGRPPALSAIPPSARPVVGNTIIGRQAELEAIRKAQGDFLLVGAPGSGKTFLLCELARSGEALFVADVDREALANAIRTQRPPAIIVDDAHVEPSVLSRLKHLRSDLGASFRLLAVTWPADLFDVQHQLGVTSSSVLKLDDIDLDTMVKIVTSVGLKGPNQLIGAIVRQANGRPGLAATLAELCLRGDAREVWTGKSLARDLLPMLRKLAGQDVTPLLACFAIGGSAGMPINAVADYLRKPLDAISSALARVGTAGVLRQDPSTKLVSIWPDSFRWQLVRDVFFGRTAIDRGPLLAHAPDFHDATLSLLAARALGAEVPELLERLAHSDSQILWGEYASLGTEEARYVVHNYPAIALKIPGVLLQACPEDILPSLLTAAVGDERALHSHPEHPLRQVQDWIQSPHQTPNERVERSRSMIAAIRQWWPACGLDDPRVGNAAVHAFCLAFDPEWQDAEPDPGSGRTVTISHGAIDSQTIRGLRALWREHHDVLTTGCHTGWKHVMDLVSEWRYSPPNVRLPDAMIRLRRQMSKEILENAAQLSRPLVAVQRQVRALAHQLKLKIATELDHDFDVLFPFRESSDWREEHARWSRDSRALGPVWLKAGPDASASRIAQYQRAAQAMGLNYPRLAPILFEAIAANIPEQGSWFEALTRADVSADLVQPFLRRMIEAKQTGYLKALEKCLESSAYVILGAQQALCQPSIPPYLAERALHKAEAFPHVLETWCLRDELTTENLEKAMRLPNNKTALAAAIGEWISATHDKRPIRAKTAWRLAIVNSANGGREALAENRDHSLGEIFKSDSSIALDWLVTMIATREGHLDYQIHRLSKKALAALSPSDRLLLLGRLDPVTVRHVSIRGLVGADSAVYGALLLRKDLAEHHLRPLEGTPSSEWRTKAVSALDAGYSPVEVMQATRLTSWGWTGDLSEMWKERKRAFDNYLADSDSRIASIARLGSEESAREVERRLEEEREEAIHGRKRRRR